MKAAAATADGTKTTGFYCPTCDAARYFEAEPDPDWVFCPECGTKMRDLASRPKYAGFWVRFAGALIDTVVVYAAFGVAWVATSLGTSEAIGEWVALGWVIAAIAHYWIGNSRGATLGKRAVGLRIVNRHGAPPGLRAGAIRLVISVFSQLVFFYGYWRMVLHEKKQTLHDTAADTYVVKR